MSDSQDDDLALKRRHRRSQARVVAIMIVALPVWWYAYHWIERRFAIDDDLARYGSLAVIVGGCAVVQALGLGERRPDDPESLRLRHLAWQRDEQHRDRFRWIGILSLGALLLICLPALPDGVPEPRPGHPAGESWLIAWISLNVVMSTTVGLPFRSAALADRAILLRHLTALRLGFVTVLLLGMAALVLNAYQPGTLPRTLPVALVLGILAQQVRLMLRRPAAAIPEQF